MSITADPGRLINGHNSAFGEAAASRFQKVRRPCAETRIELPPPSAGLRFGRPCSRQSRSRELGSRAHDVDALDLTH